MLPSEPSTPSPVPLPTWQELTKFIDEQNQKTRNTIDFWYKLAAGLLGLVLISATLVGWKTVADAKEAAVRTATETARAAVEKKLSEPAIQQLVHDTAMHMLETGEFKKDIQEEVHTKLPGAVGSEIRKQIPDLVSAKLAELGMKPRTISPVLADKYREQLKKFAGRRVVIKSKSNSEPSKFADRLQQLLISAGIRVSRLPVDPGSTENIVMINSIIWSNAELAGLIGTLLTESTGVPFASGKASPMASDEPDVSIWIGEMQAVAYPRPPNN